VADPQPVEEQWSPPSAGAVPSGETPVESDYPPPAPEAVLDATLLGTTVLGGAAPESGRRVHVVIEDN